MVGDKRGQWYRERDLHHLIQSCMPIRSATAPAANYMPRDVLNRGDLRTYLARLAYLHGPASACDCLPHFGLAKDAALG